MSEKPSGETVTIRELAAMVGISPRAIANRINRGTLTPSGKQNGVYIFDIDLAAKVAEEGRRSGGRPKGSRNIRTATYPDCQKCGSKMRRHGFTAGRRRYRCPACGKSQTINSR
ncbi:IS1/IS1595 family N-terminal zinc-binding domain-containing protein [Nitratidesulfovibrio termitidis]|uniref:IS1/IS1595 family N-terminal zinc-binding domain-containing protein n=1 Tax=Nitratidesulfovibrio termitidis TaxID=42252 RepID=UPI0012EBDB25|nr:hypothetical protein [Nitratidesulfovibrio termitidis]